MVTLWNHSYVATWSHTQINKSDILLNTKRSFETLAVDADDATKKVELKHQVE